MIIHNPSYGGEIKRVGRIIEVSRVSGYLRVLIFSGKLGPYSNNDLSFERSMAEKDERRVKRWRRSSL